MQCNAAECRHPLDDFAGTARKSCFRVTQSRRRPSSLPRCTAWVRRAAPSLSKTRHSALECVFGNEKLRGDLPIAEATGDQGEDFELACRDAEGPAGLYWE